jgi:hypothetical protein
LGGVAGGERGAVMAVYEVKITTYTRVECETAEQAEAFAREALDSISFEGIESQGEFHSFSIDDSDVIEDTEMEEEDDMEQARRG